MRYSNRIALTCSGLLFLLVVAAKADKTHRIYESASKLLEAAIARNGGKKKSAIQPEH